MKRRKFIKNGCQVCLSASALAGLLTSCSSTKYISGKLNENGMLLSVDDFKIIQNGKISYRPYLVVRNDDLKFPICVYRFSEQDYSALWMQCAHQGAEVQVSGSYLQCPAHGSEYDNRGRLTNGPATSDLRTFPITLSGNQIFIDLRKS